jgi:hypothetical protein
MSRIAGNDWLMSVVFVAGAVVVIAAGWVAASIRRVHDAYDDHTLPPRVDRDFWRE